MIDALSIKQIVARALHQDHSAVQELAAIFKAHGTALDDALIYALKNIDDIKAQFAPSAPAPTSPSLPLSETLPPQSDKSKSGLPHFTVKERMLYAYAPDDIEGQAFSFSTLLDDAILIEIAERLKDAVVAAILSKTTFKLKLVDTKDTMGAVLSSEIRAEFMRPEIKPITIFQGNKGEAGVNINILRKALSYAIPSLLA